MSGTPDEDGNVDWRAVVDLLREGKPAAISGANKREYVRRTPQVGKWGEVAVTEARQLPESTSHAG